MRRTCTHMLVDELEFYALRKINQTNIEQLSTSYIGNIKLYTVHGHITFAVTWRQGGTHL